MLLLLKEILLSIIRIKGLLIKLIIYEDRRHCVISHIKINGGYLGAKVSPGKIIISFNISFPHILVE